VNSAMRDARAPACPVPRIAVGGRPDVLAAIYDPDANAAIWLRGGPASDVLLPTGSAGQSFNIEAAVPADAVEHWLARELPAGLQPLRGDIAELAAMYACLFDVAYLGLRIRTLDRPMCPRFHVDRVTCRLLTTYVGAGTEYLANEDVDRSQLGRPVADARRPPVLRDDAPIHRMPAGAVALCKGEAWPGNEGAGFVHRSPDPEGSPRLVLSIDGLGREP
jgi:hypothetical protein